MDIQELQQLLNTIRDNGSEQYKQLVPEATKTNLQDIGGIFIEDDGIDLANEFISTMLNKHAKTVLHDKIFSNPLASLKKGTKPLGDTIEEIFVNYAKAEEYDATGANLLNRKLPDVKAVYHKMNKKNKFKVTVNQELIKKAFQSYGNLDSFIRGIINSLYNGASLTEFAMLKEIMGKAVEDGAMKVIAIDEPTASQTNGEAFIKAVKTVSGGMVFPSSDYNGYLNVQSSDTVPVTTFTMKEDQVIIIDNATNVSLDVDVLAKAFNLSKQEFMARTIVIDAFPRSEMRAVVIDSAFFQVYDDLFTFRTWRNEEGLYDNYFLHDWQTIAYSSLVNAVAFSVGSDQSADANTTVDEFDVTYTLADGISVSNDRETVIEGGSYSSTIEVAEGTTIDAVTVTMNSVDVTTTSYNSSTNDINLESINGDVVITVTTV